MAEIIEPGKPTYVIEGMQNHARVEFGCESIEDAVEMAFWAVEDNTWNAERVKNRDGDIVIDNETLSRMVMEYTPPR